MAKIAVKHMAQINQKTSSYAATLGATADQMERELTDVEQDLQSDTE